MFSVNTLVIHITSDRYIQVSTGPGQHFVFSISRGNDSRGCVGFSLIQRKWATLSVNQDIEVREYRFNPSSRTECLDQITLEVDFLAKKTYVVFSFCWKNMEIAANSEQKRFISMVPHRFSPISSIFHEFRPFHRFSSWILRHFCPL